MYLFIKEKSTLQVLFVLVVTFFKNLAKSIKGDYLMYCPCTSPIINKNTYDNFLNTFKKYKNKYDSFNTVETLKTYIWKKINL